MERELGGPLRPDSAGLAYPYYAAADSEARYAATIVDSYERVNITNIRTGAIAVLHGGPASGVVYDGELLLVQRRDGTLEVRTTDGLHLIHAFDGIANPIAGPVVSSTGLVAEVNTGGTAVVIDVDSGQEVGSIPLPSESLIEYTGIAFSPDGNYLVTATATSGGSDVTIRKYRGR